MKDQDDEQASERVDREKTFAGKIILIGDPGIGMTDIQLGLIAKKMGVAMVEVKEGFEKVRDAFAAVGKTLTIEEFEKIASLPETLNIGTTSIIKDLPQFPDIVKVVDEDNFWKQKKYNPKIGWNRPYKK